jgi:hypothetical protein
MVNDVNKDRNPVIKAVREQVEALHRRAADPCAAVRRKRESVAARIEALEGKLDRHHVALHTVDEHVGVSYRTLLGELIDLERPSPPLDVPALRPQLQKLSIGRLGTLEEEIAPLARHWLPARFEGSALAPLHSFAADRATLADFHEAFGHFVEAERLRSEVLVSRPADFEVEDPTPHRTWLRTFGQQFAQVTDQQRLLLARWLPLFRAEGKSDTTARRC